MVLDLQEGWNLRRASALTVASRELLALARGAGAARERLHYLPNGVAATSGPVSAEDKRAARSRLGLASVPHILLYSRFAEFPLAQVIRLLSDVRAMYPEVRLLVVGRGFRDEERRLEEMLAAAGLQTALHLAGWVEPDDLPDYFAAAELAIYPFADTQVNRTKCPAKLVELLAAGVPVVAEGVGQVPEYIENGQSGLLVSSGDEAGFAAAVLRLLSAQPLRDELGAGATRRIATSFLWDQLVEQAMAAYGWSSAARPVRQAGFAS
jgi:glycosyltransferase involved in cell wall biosynthesis